MRYRICGAGYPVDSWLIPTGVVIDYASEDGWSTLLRERGLPPPLNCTPLDDEATAALAAELKRIERGGI